MSGNVSPLPWTGNKACISDTLLAFMPPHERYIEPFCGSAEFLFRKPKSKVEIINDFNGDVVNFFRVIQNNEALIEFNGRLMVSANSEQLFADRKGRLIEQFVPTEIVTPEDRILTVTDEEVTRAVEFYLNQVFSFSSTGDSFGIASRSPIKRLPMILYANQRLREVCILNRDFTRVILGQSKPKTVLFCDPPYYDSTGMYKHSNFDENDTIVLFDVLSEVDKKYKGSCKFMMTNCNHPFVVDLAKKYGWDMYVKERLHNMVQSKKPGAMYEELIIANYDLKAQSEANYRFIFEESRQITLFDFIKNKEV